MKTKQFWITKAGGEDILNTGTITQTVAYLSKQKDANLFDVMAEKGVRRVWGEDFLTDANKLATTL